MMSMNFFGFNIFSKKSKSEKRIKYLSLFWDMGEINAFNNKLNKTKISENFIKKFIKFIFFIPKFQNITNSFFFSYFNKIYEKAKNNSHVRKTSQRTACGAGTTPPYSACILIWLNTDSPIMPFLVSYIAIAVSSQEVSLAFLKSLVEFFHSQYF